MRKATNKVIGLAEDGVLSWEAVARECLAEMSEDDVADMANTSGWFDPDGDGEEDEG